MPLRICTDNFDFDFDFGYGDNEEALMFVSEFLVGDFFSEDYRQFIVLLRKFNKATPVLFVNVYFEVVNGLSGMMRDVVIRICKVITRRPKMDRITKDRSIRAVIGMCQEHHTWKIHSSFTRGRIDNMWVKPSFTRDTLLARAFKREYKRPNVTGRNPISPADDMACMVEVLGSHYTFITDADDVPATLLDALLNIVNAPRAVLSEKEKELWLGVAVKGLIAPLCWYAASARKGTYRRKANTIVERLRLLLKRSLSSGRPASLLCVGFSRSPAKKPTMSVPLPISAASQGVAQAKQMEMF